MLRPGWGPAEGMGVHWVAQHLPPAQKPPMSFQNLSGGALGLVHGHRPGCGQGAEPSRKPQSTA